MSPTRASVRPSVRSFNPIFPWPPVNLRNYFTDKKDSSFTHSSVCLVSSSFTHSSVRLVSIHVSARCSFTFFIVQLDTGSMNHFFSHRSTRHPRHSSSLTIRLDTPSLKDCLPSSLSLSLSLASSSSSSSSSSTLVYSKPAFLSHHAARHSLSLSLVIIQFDTYSLKVCLLPSLTITRHLFTRRLSASLSHHPTRHPFTQRLSASLSHHPTRHSFTQRLSASLSHHPTRHSFTRRLSASLSHHPTRHSFTRRLFFPLSPSNSTLIHSKLSPSLSHHPTRHSFTQRLSPSLSHHPVNYHSLKGCLLPSLTIQLDCHSSKGESLRQGEEVHTCILWTVFAFSRSPSF